MLQLHKERISGRWSGWLLSVMTAIVVPLIYGTQHHLDHLKAERSVAGEFRYLPKGDYLKVAVLGYDQLAADLLWLKAIQVMGEKKVEQLDAENSYGSGRYRKSNSITY